MGPLAVMDNEGPISFKLKIIKYTVYDITQDKVQNALAVQKRHSE